MKIMALFTFFCYLIILSDIKSFRFFQEFYLMSNNFLLITDEGIKKYEPTTKATEDVSEISAQENEQNYISFAQFSSAEGGYIFIRIKKVIHLFDQNLNYIGYY